MSTLIHLTWDSTFELKGDLHLDFYLLFYKYKGIISTQFSEIITLLDDECRHFQWTPSLSNSKSFIINRDQPYQIPLRPGDMIGVLCLEEEETLCYVYFDPKSREGISIDLELYYPDHPDVLINLRDLLDHNINIFKIWRDNFKQIFKEYI